MKWKHINTRRSRYQKLHLIIEKDEHGNQVTTAYTHSQDSHSIKLICLWL